MLGKIRVEKLYFARKGIITSSTRTNNAELVFNPKDFVCCFVNKNNDYVDLFSGKVLKTFENSKTIGTFCIDDIEPLTFIFDHPKIKFITKSQIKRTLNDFNTPSTKRNIGKCYTEVCKFNNISYREIFEYIKSCHNNNLEQKINKNNKESEMTM